VARTPDERRRAAAERARHRAVDHQAAVARRARGVGAVRVRALGAQARIQARAARVGARIKSGLEELAARHPVITDVRGEGLFLGAELETAEAATAAVERARHNGVLLSTDGPRRNVIKLKPPLVIGDDDAERFLDALDAALR
jgi:4-aminobutyrate aminotransferase-like enzyme